MARSREWRNCTVAILLVLAWQVSPSVQNRRRDSNNMVLEISEAGQVKQFPLIQPALDAISDFWSSIAGSDSKPAIPATTIPSKAPVAQALKATTVKTTIVKPVKVGVSMPVTVINKPASAKPPAVKLMAAKPVDSKPLNVKPSKSHKVKSTTTSTTQKALLQTTLRKHKITVTPKGLPTAVDRFSMRTTRQLTTTPMKTTTTGSTTTSEVTIITLPRSTTTSTSRSYDDEPEKSPVPMIYVQRLRDLLAQLQQYNEELSNLRLEIKN